MNTIENNKIIAEFMNSKVTIDTYFITGMYISINENDLKYDTDWNWLMEVVRKIEQTYIKENFEQFHEIEIKAKISVSIENNFCQILSNGMYLNELFSINGTTKKEAVYNACVEFINWYNEQK